MKMIRSFAPAGSKNAQVVILGSIPGEKSLAAGQYYAHPRNAFWKIMEALTGLNASSPYSQRVRALNARRIVLWDVLHSCHREGSLDAAIREGSVIVNDFETFFRQHPRIHTVLFNGATAARYYNRYAAPKLKTLCLNYLRMPSTSPAHAAMSFKQKVAAWRKGLEAGTSVHGVAAPPAESN